jgi:hypothetical protein
MSKLHRKNHEKVDKTCEMCTKDYWEGGSELVDCSRCDVMHENRNGEDMCFHCIDEVWTAQKDFFHSIRPHENDRLTAIQNILSTLDIKIPAYFANIVQLQKQVETGQITEAQFNKFWELAKPVNDKFIEDTSKYSKIYEHELTKTDYEEDSSLTK